MKIRSQQAVHKRILRAVCAPRIAASTFTILAVSGAAALLVSGLFASMQPAAAQQGFGNFFGYQSPRRKRVVRKRRAPDAATVEKTETTKKEAEKTGPKQPVYVVISLADQRASIYDANGLVTRTRVSTGQAGHRTPTGVFSVIGKERWHRSNIYSGAPMPFMQRITWSGVAMHAGVVPGYPASHGCIRLPAGFAPQLFGMTKMGARVVVTPRDVAPVAFTHTLLPLPKMQPAPAMPAGSQDAAAPNAAVELASMGTPSSTMTTAAVPEATAPAASADAAAPLNPIAYAAALKKRAAADKAIADQAAKDALALAQTAGAEARQAIDDVRKAEAAVTAAQAMIASIDARIAAPVAQTVATAPVTTAANGEADKAAAQSELARAQAALEEARTRDAAKSPAAFNAVEAWKRAVAASEAAGNLVAEAARRGEQVSVFVSRKEGRIFIRQDWKEVWEAPVTIRDPDRPLGTHVYTAVEAAPDGSSIRWTAISMPPESQPTEARNGRTKDKPAQSVAPNAAAETATGALDRVELPEGARERVAELLWTGASLIVSDNPRSGEMSEYSDFIVLTR
jgi:lipoprotein-anchoring transpeptidase ErfK/SrfK